MGEKRRVGLLSCVSDLEHCRMFLKSLKDEYNTNLRDFKSRNTKKLITSITEILQELNQKQLDSLWTDASKVCFEALGIVSTHLSEKNDADREMDTDDGSSLEVLRMICVLLLANTRLEEPVLNEHMIQTLSLLHGSLFDLSDVQTSLASCICTICAEWWCKKLPSRENLCLNVVTLLLRKLLQFNKRDEVSVICGMHDCLSQFDFKRPVLSNPSVEDDTAASEANYAQSVVEELRQLLIDSFQHSLLLSDAGGRKFLANILLLHKDLMKDIHSSLMNSIGHRYSLLQAEALGNIYFQSWRIAEQEIKESVEENCIQELMYKAAHAPRAENQNSFEPLRTMLYSVVCHKTSLEVRHMITRLYSPILWRSLKANNSMVRANAASLFLDAFPLEEDDSSKRPRNAENEEFMQKQYDTLNSMLMDSCPRIRNIGIIGLCEVLHLYWDAMPAHVIAILVRKLYNDLAFDATVEVRQTVFKGTITLLDTPCAHPLLAKLLPSCVEKCLHDVNEKVRIAVADVLLAVKQTSTISFWNVCPVPNIIAQLEIDGIPVSKRLVNLILRSFIPEDKPVQNWVERCVSFFKRDINAARKFYLLIEKELSFEEIGEFLNMIGVFLYNCVTRSLQQENSSMAESEASCNSSAMNVEDSQLRNATIEEDVLAALLDTSCILWKSLDSRKSEKNRDVMKKIMITFSRTIRVCFKITNEERTLNALLLLSSNLPSGSLPVFSKGVLPKLRSLPDEVPSSYYGMLITCICSWGWSKQLLELVNEWLVEATNNFENHSEAKADGKDSNGQEEGEPVVKRRSVRGSKSAEDKIEKIAVSGVKKKKKKVVMFTGIQQERPAQALKYINAFLQVQTNSSFTALDKGLCCQLLISIAKTLGKCQGEIKRRMLSASSSWSDQLLVEALICRYRLLSLIYLHQRSKLSVQGDAVMVAATDVAVDDLRQLCEWFRDVLVQHQLAVKAQSDLNSSLVSNEATATTLLARLSFYRQIFDAVLSAFFDFLSTGIEVFDHVEEAVLHFCATDMNLIEYIPVLMKILHEIHEHKILTTCLEQKDSDDTMANTDEGNCDQSNAKLIEIFDNLLSTILQYARRTPESFSQVFRHDLRQTFRNLVKEQHLVHSAYTNKVWYNVLIKKSVSAILADLLHEVRSSRHFLSQSRISEFPAFSAAVLPVICATSAETAYVCENVILPLAAEEAKESNEQMTLIFAVLLHILSIDGKNKPIALACLATLSQEITGFSAALAKVKDGENSPNGEESAIVPEESGKDGVLDDETSQEEKIVVLENPGQRDMFMNDEEFMM